MPRRTTLADETRQDQQATRQGHHQAFEHGLGGQVAAIQAFTGTQRRGQAGDAQHQDAEHRAENDQQQGREKADRTADLNEYEQLQHREQQKEQ